MLDKTKDIQATTAATAMAIAVNAQVGPNSQIGMTFYLPLDMTLKDINKYVDKVLKIADYQNDKNLLLKLNLELAAAKKQMQTSIEQKANAESKYRLDHVVTNRRGEWKPTGSQEKELENHERTIKHGREVIIPKIEKDIAELERRIAEGE
jgi:hypothetical protein